MAEPQVAYSLRGHEDGVNCVSFLSNSILSSGGSDGIVIIWDLLTRRPVFTFTPHGPKSILSLSPLQAMQRLVSCGRDGTVKVWDINRLSSAGKTASAWDDGPTCSLDAGFSQFCNASTDILRQDISTVLLPCDDEAAALVWDIREPSRSARKIGLGVDVSSSSSREGMLCSLAYLSSDPGSGDGPVAIMGHESGIVRRVCMRTNRVLSEWRNGSDAAPVLSVHGAAQPAKHRCVIAAGGGGAHIAVARHEHLENPQAIDADVKVEEVPSAAGTAVEPVHASLPAEGTSVVRLRSDGRLLVTGHWDCSIRLFDTKRLKPLATIHHHRDSVYAVDFAPAGPGGHWFASGGKDGCVALWDLLESSYSSHETR